MPPIPAQETPVQPEVLSNPEVNFPVQFDVSHPLSEMATEAAPQQGLHLAPPVLYPKLQLLTSAAQRGERPVEDGALQTSVGPLVSTTPGLNLLGVGNGFPNYTVPDAPTDVNLAVACIPQRGISTQLDSLGDRLMYRLAYRNFSDHQTWLVSHSVTAGSSVGERWYEFHAPETSTALSVFQQGTFAPDSNYRWMGSIAMDSAQDIALGYSVSSSSMYPSISYTGRVPGDPTGTMESEAQIVAGTGSQTDTSSRWGDYTSMAIDAADDCTFWYTNQY